MNESTFSFGGIPIYTSDHIQDGQAYVLGGGSEFVVPKGLYDKIRGLEATQVWFDDYAETDDGVGYLRSEALKKLKAEDAQRELEAVPGFGSF
jgi:hypothetical protein